jgi:hypothetical protein
MRPAVLFALFMLSACAAPGGPYPSLQPRAAERIDPRVPVGRPVNDRPVGTSLARGLAALVAEARGSEQAFDAAAAAAERAASAAGARQSESWIAAQEALTAAIAARKPVTAALAEIDEMAARAVQVQGGIAPNDLAAIDRASADVSMLDRRQVARIKAIQNRLRV